MRQIKGMFARPKEETKIDPMPKIVEPRKKLECDCEKDPNYSFGCRNAVVWFAENVLINKIRRLQRESESAVDVRVLVNQEY